MIKVLLRLSLHANDSFVPTIMFPEHKSKACVGCSYYVQLQFRRAPYATQRSKQNKHYAIHMREVERLFYACAFVFFLFYYCFSYANEKNVPHAFQPGTAKNERVSVRCEWLSNNCQLRLRFYSSTTCIHLCIDMRN